MHRQSSRTIRVVDIFSSDAPPVIVAGTLLIVTSKGCEVDSGGMEETDSSSRVVSSRGGLPALSVFVCCTGERE